MAKYSSDSDSDRSSNKYRRKHSRKSSSVDSSDSSSSHPRRQKYSKSKKRYHSRSRSRDKDRSTKSYKHVKGSSRDRKRYRTQRSKSSSPDRNRSKKRSASREKSSSRSSSSQSNVKTFNVDKPNSTSKEFVINDLKIKASVFDELNNDEFVPKQFVSSAKNKESKIKNIMIDINADVIHAPPITADASDISNSIFHTSITTDKEIKFDKWVKRLYSLRQKAVNELNYI